MSMNFSELKRRKIKTTIETGDRENPVLIYNPDKKQRVLILDLLLKNTNTEELEKENKVKSSLSGYDIMLTLLPELTNIELGLDINKEEDKQIIEQVLDDPSDLLLDVRDEINEIANKQYLRYYKHFKELVKLPVELREAYLDNLDKLAKEQEFSTEETDKLKEIKDLEDKLKSLRGEKQ